MFVSNCIKTGTVDLLCGTTFDSALRWHDSKYKPVISQKCCSCSRKVLTATVRRSNGERGGDYFLQQVGQVWKWAELLSFMMRKTCFHLRAAGTGLISDAVKTRRGIWSRYDDSSGQLYLAALLKTQNSYTMLFLETESVTIPTGIHQHFFKVTPFISANSTLPTSHKSFIGHLWAKDFFLHLPWRSCRILLNLFQVCLKLRARNVFPILSPLSVIVSTTPSSGPDCLTSVMCPRLLRSIWNLIANIVCFCSDYSKSQRLCLQHTFMLSLPLIVSLQCCFKG